MNSGHGEQQNSANLIEMPIYDGLFTTYTTTWLVLESPLINQG